MAILPSPIVKLSDPLFSQKHLQVFIKRDDLIHPEISGNKWRKLKYNLQEAKSGNYEGIVTLVELSPIISLPLPQPVGYTKSHLSESFAAMS